MTKPLQDTTACKRFRLSKHCQADCYILEMLGNPDHFYLLRKSDWEEVRDLLSECFGPQPPRTPRNE
jgi:hypothetical protein